MAALSAPSAAAGARVAVPSTGLERGAALGALVAVTAWVAYAGGLYTYDDAFITYRMAANLASGHGFVYNPGEWHLGSTAALYGLILAALGWLLGPDRIPVLSGVLSCASLFATGLMLPALGAGASSAAGGGDAARADDIAGWRAGVAAGLLYAASPLLFVTFGGEMPFLLALVTGAFLAERRGRPRLSAVLAALAALTRPDGVQVIAMVLATMAISAMFRMRRRPSPAWATYHVPTTSSRSPMVSTLVRASRSAVISIAIWCSSTARNRSSLLAKFE